MTDTPAPFENLSIPHKGAPSGFGGSYRVYKNPKEFIIVKAATALEALETSGLKDVFKIERERLDGYAVLASSSWTKEDAKAEAAAPPSAEEAASSAPAAAEQPAAAG